VSYTRNRIDLSEERKIMSYLITSTEFLRQMKGTADPVLFESPYVRLLASWVWEYFDQIEEAPGKNIEDLYTRKKNQVSNEDDTELIAEFLKKLSDDSVELRNVQYAVSSASEYFRIRKLVQIKEQLQTAIDSRDVENGEHLISSFKRIGSNRGSGVDLLRDTAPIVQAFGDKDEILFTYPGALGSHVGPIVRGDFVSFLARPKMGKSYSLFYTSHHAALMGYHSFFFSLEMTQNRILRRAWQAFRGKPLTTSQVSIPYFSEVAEEGKWEVKMRMETRDGVDTEMGNIANIQKKYRQQVTGGVRIFALPASSTSLTDIRNIIDNCMYYEGIVPDMIVIDYADIMRFDIKGELRNQLNDLWQKLRGLAQELNCAVVTASQVNRAGNKGDVNLTHVAEDYRKGGHVTKMIALNQEPEERERGIIRWNKVLEREGQVFLDQVAVLHCRDIGREYLDSRKRSEVI
jgi:replicative DNA helicase